MIVFCAGFNLYGQFTDVSEKCIEQFTCTNYTDVTDLKMNHSFSIVKAENNNGCKIYFHGFMNNKIHQKEELDINDDIVEISVSDCKALFLSKKQQIFSFKYNTNCNYDLRLLPSIIDEKLEGTKSHENVILKVSSGTCMSNAYSSRGYIYNIPSQINCDTLMVQDMCTGREHCLLLSKDGLVYSFGGASRGQLGHGDLEDKNVPEVIKCLEGIKIEKIACGAWHSTAVSSEGDVYTWGWNSNGQLGTKKQDVSIIASPELVEINENIIDICCGSRHTVILSENLKLYGCGWNKYCQLGFKSDLENHYEFVLLYDFNKFNIIGLRCGAWNTAVLVES